MNRNGKFFLNKQCFYQNTKMFCGINSYNMCLNAVIWHWHSPTITLPLVLLPCRWYVVQSPSRNPLFRRCAKLLLLLWKPDSWF